MKKWVKSVSAWDTRMWVVLYFIAASVAAVFTAFIYPPKALAAAGTPMLVHWISFGGAFIGVATGLFIGVYVNYFIYLILRSILNQDAADKTLVKRSLYLATCISTVVSSLLSLLLMVIIGGEPNQMTNFLLAVVGSAVLAYLIYNFFSYLVKQVKLARWYSGILFIIYLLPTLIGLLLKK
ncbi:hypothetical protein [Loigolactobacillus backii]|uniref:Uncharacterized protein n=1 Tax=Loigolactobacillus backii TaxID=375175 RepID=A0A192H0B5_9LACO|nr:hypothetical protein [Loigolactobacillus backii]ANK58923.1 hypothetical protein AYR52_00765 [Loigolactobacillus backii]ANK61406.1 hypothetical protein AYR53_00715 [Loigolactobacillus backii]ANK63911.1 hypothetical protein AYR54_00750 [Loigolactobacillus backii]ANK66359.1 hypothetical protein AYR55_00755 [Loigolactobacillus backii]ANK69394.1 hypothetical protein AYR56_04000 [Loigolactobacillus backii]